MRQQSLAVVTFDIKESVQNFLRGTFQHVTAEIK
jgi:hypothetical protein